MGVEGSSVCICQSCAGGLMGTVIVDPDHSFKELRCYTGLRSSLISLDSSIYCFVFVKVCNKLGKVMPSFEFTSGNPAEILIAAFLKLDAFLHLC